MIMPITALVILFSCNRVVNFEVLVFTMYFCALKSQRKTSVSLLRLFASVTTAVEILSNQIFN